MWGEVMRLPSALARPRSTRPDRCSTVKHSARAPTQRTGLAHACDPFPWTPPRMSTLNITASYEEARTRRANRLTRRERAVEVAVGGCFLLAALALLLLGE